MEPFQIFYLWLSLVVFGLAWLRGGHPERMGVVMLVVAFLASYPLHPLRIGVFWLGDFIVDVVLASALLWLALRRDRWWTLAAAAFAVLTIAAHLVMLTVPGMDARGDIAARWGLGVLTILCLAGGVLERWLAGEPPVSREARWGAGASKRVLNI